MKTKNFIIYVLFLIMLIGCESESIVAPAVSGELAPVATTADNAASISTADVKVIGLGTVVGTSTLVRNNNGISFKLNTTDLDPGDVHTIWIVIFNNSNFVASIWGAGTIAGGTGTASFAGHLNEGEITGFDARTSEIHLVVRTHGPVIPELVNEMISSFSAGCPPNTCANIQFAMHKPV